MIIHILTNLSDGELAGIITGITGGAIAALTAISLAWDKVKGLFLLIKGGFTVIKKIFSKKKRHNG